MQWRPYGPRCVPSGQTRPGTMTTGATGATTAGATTTALGRQPPYGPRWKPAPHPPATRVMSEVSCESRGAIGRAWALNDKNDPSTAHVKEKLSVLDIGLFPPMRCSSIQLRQFAARNEAWVHTIRGVIVSYTSGPGEAQQDQRARRYAQSRLVLPGTTPH